MTSKRDLRLLPSGAQRLMEGGVKSNFNNLLQREFTEQRIYKVVDCFLDEVVCEQRSEGGVAIN